MPFLKFARSASVVDTSVTRDTWKARYQPEGRVRTAAARVLGQVDPEKYLLTHCTIVASVDTEPGPQTKKASPNGGAAPNIEYPDYFVTAATEKWINNNDDCFERRLLLDTFKSFVGGHNFVEHRQIVAESKGRIVDAVARDVGGSIYIDLLVATHRKHEELVESILEGNTTTLSMGARVAFTICSKCGNTAADETTLCDCIKYEKGSSFTDVHGNTRRIAELCGHRNEKGSVVFFEASWVDVPAFTGAIIRTVLTPTQAKRSAGKVRGALSSPAPSVSQDNDTRLIAAADSGADDPKDKGLEELTTQIADEIFDRALEQARERLSPKTKPAPGPVDRNESLIHASSKKTAARTRVLQATRDFPKLGWKVVATHQLSGAEALALARAAEVRRGSARDDFTYALVASVGGIRRHGTFSRFLEACRATSGRSFTAAEEHNLMQKAKIFDTATNSPLIRAE
jgi:hypothetical protein